MTRSGLVRSGPLPSREVAPGELLGPLNEVEQKYAPARLFISGSIPLPLPRPRLAVVGTRQPSRSSVDVAREIARFVVHEGGIVVSGLALGIDTAAHKSAIEAGGRTIAVLGTPLDRTYPRENQDLQAEIAERHLVVSQFPPGYPTRPASFIQRNRTMALIADASVIVQSGDTGGSLHQGWEALRLGRPLYIWHEIFRDSSLKWPALMVEYGAVELKQLEDLVEALPSSSVGQSIDAVI